MTTCYFTVAVLFPVHLCLWNIVILCCFLFNLLLKSFCNTEVKNCPMYSSSSTVLLWVLLWVVTAISKFNITGFMFSICYLVISYNSSLHTEEMCFYQLEIVIHHSGARCCGITYRWVNIDKRLTEDMSCRAAAWGPQWAHWADTETVRLATTTWRQLLVRGQFKEPGFCLLCSHCLPVRGWAP